MKSRIALALLPMALASGCASTLTPTTEQESAYAIYQVTPAEGVTASQVAEAIKVALQKNTNNVHISRSIPPSPLPEKPGRFSLDNPFRGTGLAAIAGAQGQHLQFPTCDGALILASAQNTGMSNYGENTRFLTCLWAYEGGYHIDVYSSFTKGSGSFSLDTLGATLARKVVGDTSQFIPRTINSIVTEVEQLGAQVTLVESYP